jgi:hypothetical protein
MLVLGWRDVLGMIFDGAHDLHFRLGQPLMQFNLNLSDVNKRDLVEYLKAI